MLIDISHRTDAYTETDQDWLSSSSWKRSAMRFFNIGTDPSRKYLLYMRNTKGKTKLFFCLFWILILIVFFLFTVKPVLLFRKTVLNFFSPKYRDDFYNRNMCCIMFWWHTLFANQTSRYGSNNFRNATFVNVIRTLFEDSRVYDTYRTGFWFS